MDPITNSAAQGLTQLAEYGIAGILAMLLIVGAVFMLRYFMNEFKACHESTRKGLENSTEALNGVKIVLAEIKARMDK